MKPRFKFIVALLGLALVLVFAFRKKHDNQSSGLDYEQAVSVVNIPISAKLDDLEERIMREIPQPLVSGSDVIDVSINVAELIPCRLCQAGKVLRKIPVTCPVCGGDGVLHEILVPRTRRVLGRDIPTPGQFERRPVPCPAPNCILTQFLDELVDCPECALIKAASGIEKYGREQIKVIATQDVNVEYSVDLAKMDLSFSGDELQITADIEAKYKISPQSTLLTGDVIRVDGFLSSGWQDGKEKPMVRLILKGKVLVDDEATVHFEETSAELQWLRSPNLTALNFADTGRSLDDITQLPFVSKLVDKELTKAINKEISGGFSLSKEARKLWDRALEPIDVDAGEGKVTLWINPVAIGFSKDLSGDGTFAYGNLQVKAKPEILYGDLPRTSKPGEFSLSPSEPAQGFELVPRIGVGFSEVETALKKILATSDDITKYITISDVRILGRKEKIVIELDVTKPFTATLQLEGRIAYHLPEGVAVENFDFSVDSESRVADAGIKLIKKPIVDNLGTQLKFALQKQINTKLPWLNKIIQENTDYSSDIDENLKLGIVIREIQPVGFSSDRNQQELLLRVLGDLHPIFQKKP